MLHTVITATHAGKHDILLYRIVPRFYLMRSTQLFNMLLVNLSYPWHVIKGKLNLFRRGATALTLVNAPLLT